MNARHEKIFKRKCGSLVKVVAEIRIPMNAVVSYGIQTFKYENGVYFTESCVYGPIATQSEIQETKMELWESLKP